MKCKNVQIHATCSVYTPCADCSDVPIHCAVSAPMNQFTLTSATLSYVIPVVRVTNNREGSVVNQHNYLERCYILIMKLHISAYSGHRLVSIPIKGSLYTRGI